MLEREIERRDSGKKVQISQKARPCGRIKRRDTQEPLVSRCDSKAISDPREDKQAERSFGIERGQREPIDLRIRDLIGDNMRSPIELRTERMLNRYEREMAFRETARDYGDVYLDRHDLKELRSADNDYIHRKRSLE